MGLRSLDGERSQVVQVILELVDGDLWRDVHVDDDRVSNLDCEDGVVVVHDREREVAANEDGVTSASHLLEPVEVDVACVPVSDLDFL